MQIGRPVVHGEFVVEPYDIHGEDSGVRVARKRVDVPTRKGACDSLARTTSIGTEPDRLEARAA